MSCGLCKLVLEESQHKATLMCGHSLHTHCFIIGLIQTDIHDKVCEECTENVITPEIHAAIIESRDTSKIYKVLEETSEDFNNDIKIITTKNKEYTKSVNKFKSKLTPIISEFKAHVRPQINLLKNYIKNKISTIKQTQEYKDAVKKHTDHERSYNKITTKYNLGPYEFRDYLINKGKYVSVYTSVSRRLERQFRIRI
jgi:archaellum component FlaC